MGCTLSKSGFFFTEWSSDLILESHTSPVGTSPGTNGIPRMLSICASGRMKGLSIDVEFPWDYIIVLGLFSHCNVSYLMVGALFYSTLYFFIPDPLLDTIFVPSNRVYLVGVLMKTLSPLRLSS